MASVLLLGACLALITFFVYKYMYHRPPNFPPGIYLLWLRHRSLPLLWPINKKKFFDEGPPRLPFFGSYLFMLLLDYNHVHKALDKLCHYYKSDIIGFYINEYPTIVVHNTELSLKCLNRREFDGKPSLPLAKLRSPDDQVRGIFFTEGEQWHEQRRYFLRNLRDYGFGRRYDELELEMRDELSGFIDLLRNGPKYEHEKKYMKDGNVLCPHIFHAVTFNGFMKVITNERIPRSEQDVIFEAGEMAYEFLTKSDDWGLIFSIVPEMATLFPQLSGYTEMKEISKRLYDHVEKMIDERLKTFDANHERHFLDQYFNEMKAGDFDENYVFNYKQLILSCVDFFTPSLNATAITLQFLLQRLYFQPEILNKIQHEIDAVVGHGRLPELNDRINLPYLEATLREIMRYETLVPSGLPHRALEDTKFEGYDIPKGSLVYASLYACHKDPSTWNQPELFRPERFLDESGRLCVQKDHSLPFGAGKRLCAGETFARNTLFLVAAALLQNFSIEMPHGHRMPDPSETMTGTPTYPPKYWIEFVAR